MPKRNPTSWTFSALGSPKAKLLLLGQDCPLHGAVIAEARSFSIEHVSPGQLVQQEISRHTNHGHSAAAALQRDGAVSDRLTLAVLRKWFWARKPDAGFLLSGFPATLLQAKVFDEWLETRGESLSGCFTDVGSADDPVATHYRTQGLLFGVPRAAA